MRERRMYVSVKNKRGTGRETKKGGGETKRHRDHRANLKMRATGKAEDR